MSSSISLTRLYARRISTSTVICCRSHLIVGLVLAGGGEPDRGGFGSVTWATRWLVLPVPHNSFAELRPADSQGMETRNQVGQGLRGDFARLQRLLANEVFADAGDAHPVRPGYFRVLKSGCRGLRGTGRAFSAPPPGAPVRPHRRPAHRSVRPAARDSVPGHSGRRRSSPNLAAAPNRRRHLPGRPRASQAQAGSAGSNVERLRPTHGSFSGGRTRIEFVGHGQG